MTPAFRTSASAAGQVPHFGDPDREYRAFAGGAALLDRSHRTRIEHGGSDALDLLHRLTTNDLVELADGDARGTIVTNGDARIIDVLTVARLSARSLLLLGSPSTAGRLLEWLDQYTFGEDSTPRDVTAETAQFTLIGPSAISTLESAAKPAAPRLAPGGHAQVTVAGHPVEVIRTDGAGGETVELVLPVAAGEDVWSALTQAGAVPAGVVAYDAHRVARGIPEHGKEIDERVNPHEANLVPLVSFTKGCYIGQEIVARLDTYDKVQRRLVGVRSREQLREGATLSNEGRPAGDIRTVAGAGPYSGRAALAYVRRGSWDPDTVLQQEGGAEVRVVAWPLD